MKKRITKPEITAHDIESIGVITEFFDLAVPTLLQVEAALLTAAMKASSGNVLAAAKMIGVSFKTAYNWKEKYRL